MTTPAETLAPVTVIGLGSMGTALANAFLDKGHPTTVWNRSPEKGDELVAKGAVLATTVPEAVSASTLIVVCVLDYQAMHDVLESSGAPTAGKVIVNLTSGTPTEARETGQWAVDESIDYLDGAIMAIPPMIGGEETLIFFGGPEQVYREHEQTLTTIAGAATYLGEDCGLPSLYDVALLGFMWTTWSGFMHALALVGTEKVPAAELLPYAQTWLQYVISPEFEGIAKQADDGIYPDDGSSLGMQVVAIQHLLHASEAQKVDTALPSFLLARAEQANRQGHAADSYFSVIEALRSPGNAS